MKIRSIPRVLVAWIVPANFQMCNKSTKKRRSLPEVTHMDSVTNCLTAEPDIPRCVQSTNAKCVLLGLSRRGCIYSTSSIDFRSFQEILHGSIKKIIKKYSKRKNLELIKVRKFLGENFWNFSKIFIEICMNMKNVEMKKIEFFRPQKFRKFSLKIVWKWKNLRSKFFEIFRSQKFSDDNFKLLQLFSFSIKLFDFFYGSM